MKNNIHEVYKNNSNSVIFVNDIWEVLLFLYLKIHVNLNILDF